MPNYKIKWSPIALHDLDRHRIFIKKQTPSAAKKAVSRIKDAIKILHDNPELGTVFDRSDNRRELYISFGRDAFIIRYRIHTDKNDLLILRVHHSREDR